ncbi:MAG: 3-hydroxybutyryl-CoA dehydrogenase [bacterium]|nr:3-hydroxybutyryl-CoA dehydrogenase [bacterium]
MDLKTVGVVGCGLMGSGIAQIAAQAGFAVVVRELDQAALDKGRAKIDKFLGKAVAKGKLEESAKDEILGRIKFTTDLADFAPCDLVVEAIIENLELKRELFAALDKICAPHAIFSSNTSSLAVGDMATTTNRAANFVGLHFFNPVPLMRLVEVVRTLETSDEVFDAACAFGEKVGKTVVRAKDSPGFVVNLLLVPYLLDAIRALESGVATKEDIDAGMKLGCGHPMGPLELLDFVGLDTTMYIADIMFHEFKQYRYSAPPMLRRLVASGRNGRKSGRGFYDYSR